MSARTLGRSGRKVQRTVVTSFATEATPNRIVTAQIATVSG